MTDKYRGGYKKALLDVRNLLEHDMVKECKSKKQVVTLCSSLLERLLTTPEELDTFMDMVDAAIYAVDPKTREIKYIRRK